MHCRVGDVGILFRLTKERHQAAQDGVVANDQNRVVAIHGVFLDQGVEKLPRLLHQVLQRLVATSIGTGQL